MSLASPITYAEFYWKHNVDAQKAFADDSVHLLSPHIDAIFADLYIPESAPAGIKSFISALSSPKSFQFLPAIAAVGMNAVDNVFD
ncbi:unnamed protein product, partial [marine sediment metagenome]